MSRAAGRKSTLIFCVDLAHVSDLTATFRQHGIDARFITGDTPKQIRGESLDAFRNGEYPVLLNCGVFTEGTDIPNIDCIVLARPTRSRNLLIQMIGRGMRLHPGKENCHVIDMVASLAIGIVTTPTLFGLDPAEVVEGADVAEMRAQKQRELETLRQDRVSERRGPKQSSPQTPMTVTFTDYHSVYDLIDDTAGEKHIRGISPLSWVMVNQNRHVLSNQNGDYIAIEKADSKTEYSVVYMQKIPKLGLESRSKGKSPYMRPREIATAARLSDAVHAADTFALRRFPWKFVQNAHSWRRAPATTGQLAFLNKLRRMEDQLTADMLTKGKATDMISKIKFGAKGWFNKLEAGKKRNERVVEKALQVDDLRKRELVRLGPVA